MPAMTPSSVSTGVALRGPLNRRYVTCQSRSTELLAVDASRPRRLPAADRSDCGSDHLDQVDPHHVGPRLVELFGALGVKPTEELAKATEQCRHGRARQEHVPAEVLAYVLHRAPNQAEVGHPAVDLGEVVLETL